MNISTGAVEQNILLVHEVASKRKRLATHLEAHPNVASVVATYDLCRAFDYAEHNLPNFVFTSPEFARQPEFEIFAALIRATGATCIILGHESKDEIQYPFSSKFKTTVASEQDCLGDLSGVLMRAQGREPAQCFDPSLGPGDRTCDLNRAILIGASTGGVDALIKILSDFPRQGPPIMIVQHTGGEFLGSLARLLDRKANITVKTAIESEPLLPGCAYLAPSSDVHLRLAPSDQFRCELSVAPPIMGHRPAVDELFRSAVPHASRTTAAILTGMGCDGAAGMYELRNAGARTLAQDKKSSVIFGMPSSAIDAGGVERIVSLKDMNRSILETCVSHPKRLK